MTNKTEIKKINQIAVFQAIRLSVQDLVILDYEKSNLFINNYFNP